MTNANIAGAGLRALEPHVHVDEPHVQARNRTSPPMNRTSAPMGERTRPEPPKKYFCKYFQKNFSAFSAVRAVQSVQCGSKADEGRLQVMCMGVVRFNVV
jgi:hypothetical protein